MPEARCIVTFEPSGDRVEVAAGVTVLAAAALAGVSLAAPCGGIGACGGCAVQPSGSLEPPGADERVLLSLEALTRGVRIACRARVSGDATIHPLRAVPPAELRIVETGDLGEVSVEPPERRALFGPEPLLGAVVDLGTTTIVVALVDLRTGETLASASALNPQHPFGHDVLSRISHVATSGIDALRAPVVGTIEDLTLGLLQDAGLGVDHLREIAVAGNTTMLHILLGFDPAPLGTAPYAPVLIDAVDRPAAEVGFSRLGGAGAYVLPGISAFLGADITAGLLTTRLAERESPTLFIDLGTNGEIVLRAHGRLVGASTAAGPALEGANIEYGMLAESGAIERVTLVDSSLALGTIGDGQPVGLCGSGLIDLIGILLETGVVDRTGLMHADVPHPLAARVSVRDSVRVFELAPGVYLTQRDIRQVQLASAAVATGIGLLLESAGIEPDEVAEVVIAGGFGFHVRADALARMGMVPRTWHDRVTYAGNSSIAGATRALLDRGQRRLADAIARHVETIDLAAHPEFQERFIRALEFPAS
ncbi:MAG TPA: ASKHA domain-containing protein [Coriobacteriia bacterium]